MEAGLAASAALERQIIGYIILRDFAKLSETEREQQVRLEAFLHTSNIPCFTYQRYSKGELDITSVLSGRECTVE